MGKSAPDSPDPQALIKAQVDANRVNQYTPYGNLQYGNFDANGNFVPNAERESAVQTMRPQDQQFQNYSDAGRNALFSSIFGNYQPAASSSATGTNASPMVASETGGNLASAMASQSSGGNQSPQGFGSYYDNYIATGLRDVTPFSNDGRPRIKGANMSSPMGNQGQVNNQTSGSSVAPNPYGNGQGGGMGSFEGFNLADRADVGSLRGGLPSLMSVSDISRNLSGFGNPESLKYGLNDFYNLGGIKGSMPSVSTDFSADRQRAEDAVYKRASDKLGRDFGERRRQLEQRLADTGNVMGSEGYSTEMDRLARMENEGYGNAALDAIRAGSDEYQRLSDLGLRTRGQLFGEDTSLAGLTSQQRAQQFGENQGVFNAQNQLRQQQLAEAMGLADYGSRQRNQLFGENKDIYNAQTGARSNQLNEMMGLLGMGQQQPNFVSPSQVDAAGIMQQDYANRMNAYNNQMGGLGSLLGTGAQLFGGYMGWL